MERRFTGFLIPILIATLVYLLFFGPEEKKPTAAPDVALQDPAVRAGVVAAEQKQPQHKFEPEKAVFRHTFGELPSATGDGHGFQVTFSRYGAGVRAILLNDHFITPAAAARAKADPASLTDRDFYAITPVYPPRGGVRAWGYGLVLEGRGANRFAKAIDDGPKNQLWEAETPEPGADEVVFRLDVGEGLQLEKVFRYEAHRRDLALKIRLRRVGTRPEAAPTSYQMALRGVHLWNPKRERVFTNPAIAVGAVTDVEGEKAVSLTAAEATKQLLSLQAGQAFSFAGTTNRFFGGFLFPEDQATATAVGSVDASHWPLQETVVPGMRDGKEERFVIEPGSVPEVRCNVTLAVPEPDQAVELGFRLYLGPKSTTEFDKFEADYGRFGVVTDKDLDPVSCCCPIPGISALAKAITWVLRGFYSLCGNWGVAIIMLTLLVRMLLSPLNFNMQRTMRAHGAKMAKIKPEMEALQKKHKDDPKRLQMEMMKFNKEHQLLTAPLKGCLPILVTMPVWFGLFTALRVMYDLRHQPFVSWIDDLSTPDHLIHLGIPYIEYFNLLPILMVGLWLYLQMGTPLPKDPQQRQMMVMMRFMPVMMGVMLYNYASGLMVYMCTSSVWGIVEQKITKRILGPVDPDSGMNMPTMV